MAVQAAKSSARLLGSCPTHRSCVAVWLVCCNLVLNFPSTAPILLRGRHMAKVRVAGARLTAAVKQGTAWQKVGAGEIPWFARENNLVFMEQIRIMTVDCTPHQELL